jgi:hypothetical protein
VTNPSPTHEISYVSHDDTPWAYVLRRRAEGAANEAIAKELSEHGHEADDIAFLLRRQGADARQHDSGTAVTATESAWSVLQRMRAEGFPRKAIEAELGAQGYSTDDVAALFADDPMKAAPGRHPGQGPVSGGSESAVDIIFGAALIVLGGAILLAGIIGLLPLGLIVSGGARIAAGFRTQRSQAVADAIASEGLRQLAADDPRVRCSLHLAYAAIGACARCGTFCCAGCVTSAGFSGSTPCLACHRRPEYLAERLLLLKQRSTRRLFLGPALLVLIFAIEVAGADEPLLFRRIGVIAAVLSAPWLALVGLQFVSRQLWPTFLSAFVWLATTGLFVLFVGSGGTPLHLGAWLFAAWPAVSAWLSKRSLEAPVTALILSPHAPMERRPSRGGDHHESGSSF